MSTTTTDGNEEEEEDKLKRSLFYLAEIHKNRINQDLNPLDMKEHPINVSNCHVQAAPTIINFWFEVTCNLHKKYSNNPCPKDILQIIQNYLFVDTRDFMSKKHFGDLYNFHYTWEKGETTDWECCTYNSFLQLFPDFKFSFTMDVCYSDWDTSNGIKTFEFTGFYHMVSSNNILIHFDNDSILCIFENINDPLYQTLFGPIFNPKFNFNKIREILLNVLESHMKTRLKMKDTEGILKALRLAKDNGKFFHTFKTLAAMLACRTNISKLSSCIFNVERMKISKNYNINKGKEIGLPIKEKTKIETQLESKLLLCQQIEQLKQLKQLGLTDLNFDELNLHEFNNNNTNNDGNDNISGDKIKTANGTDVNEKEKEKEKDKENGKENNGDIEKNSDTKPENKDEERLTVSNGSNGKKGTITGDKWIEENMVEAIVFKSVETDEILNQFCLTKHEMQW